MAIACTVLSSVCMGSPAESRGYPQAEITNGVITATVATETQRMDNYYRAQRFDWSGIIYALKYKGHSYFGEWVDKFDPYLHDSICGPVEEFTQIGYENAKVGEEFLKIGVGTLKKKSNDPYSFREPYEIVNNGKWECSTTENSATYVQTLKSKLGSYVYKKTIELVPNSPVMKIKHSFKNIGDVAINTSVYNHNFFMLDGEPTGKAISLRFAFEPKNPEIIKYPENGKIVKDLLTFNKDFAPGEMILFRGLKGENKVENYDFRLENSKTGAAVRFRGDRPVTKITFWACRNTQCAEPFIDINVKPGEEFDWSITYDFYTTK